MNDSTSTPESSNVQQLTVVPFHGRDLITIQDGDTVRVAMKPICDAIGLQWEAQHKRIKRDEVLSATMSIMDMVAEDGKVRSLVTLPLNMLNGWLFGVEAKRVKPEIRDRLITYKFECYQALASYWQVGVAINPRIGLTPEHQHGLQKAIAAKIYANVPKSRHPAAFKRVYRHLKDRFGVAKYDQIDDSRYTEALGAVQSFELEGEWLDGKAPAESLVIDAPRAKHWTEYTVGELLGDSSERSQISEALNTLRRAARSGAHVSVADMEAIEQEVAALRHVTETAMNRVESMTTNLGCVQRHADIAERTWTGTIGPAVAMFDQALAASMREHLGVLSRLIRHEVQRPRLAFAS